MSGVLISNSGTEENSETTLVELNRLKELLRQKEQQVQFLQSSLACVLNGKLSGDKQIVTTCDSKTKFALQNFEVNRYSRQIILPEIGVKGQLLLKEASILIVGAGGLGCPAAAYLASVGVGKLGIVDYDEVELCNLNRQIFHKEENVGLFKCESLVSSLKQLNSCVQYATHKLALSSKNIIDVISPYDIILDASDNVPTRYLLNDACVLYGKPLVSGSALRFEGQLTVFNFNGGLCYRCMYPTPPPPETVTNCSDGGILGAVTGVIGSLQALEAVKIIVGLTPSYSSKLLLFDGLSGEFRTIKLRMKKSDCVICGDCPTITTLIDYEVFCNSKIKDKVENLLLLSEEERVSCSQYKNILESNVPHILLDVRPKCETDICHLENYSCLPFTELKHKTSLQKIYNLLEKKGMPDINYVICHRGNDSQKAVKILQEYFKSSNIKWYDIKGGLQAWHDEVDISFPVY